MPETFRILHVVASLQGGAAHHVLHLAQGFLERGYQVAIAAPGDNSALESAIEDQRIPFYRIPLNHPLPLKSIFILKRLLEREPWTHIHVHGHRAALLARMVCRLVSKPPWLIYTVHGYHPLHYPNPVFRWIVNTLERFFSRWTNWYICVSESTRNDLAFTIPSALRRCSVVENAIPIPDWSEEERGRKRDEIRNLYQIPPKAFLIGMVGRLQWQKSIDRLLLSIQILRERYDDLFILIVGDGPLRQDLESLADTLSIRDICRFAGHQSHPSDFYPAMDLFVLTSLWEGLPLTILEAWSVGTPVAATDVPGSRDMIRDGINGFLAENSVEGIVKAIEAFRSQPSRIDAIRQNALQEIARRFTLARMVEQTEKIYRDTFDRNRTL